MEKYNWLVTESALEKYPMRIIDGNLICGPDSSFYIPPDRIQFNGLGEVGSIHLSEEKLRFLPLEIQLKWFSYTENKFFEIKATLPLEILSDYFSKGIVSRETGGAIPCDKINVGIWPEGKISIYVCAERLVKEVFFGRGGEIILEWQEFSDNESESRIDQIETTLKGILSESEYENYRTKRAPTKLAEKYRYTYLWSPFVLTTAVLGNYWNISFNGEHEYIDCSGSDDGEINARPLPKKNTIKWAGSASANYCSFIEYNEDEIYASFDKLISIHPKEMNKLQIEINKHTRTIRIFVVNAHNYIELKKCIINTYVVN